MEASNSRAVVVLLVILPFGEQWNLPSCLMKCFFGFFAADGFIECLCARRPPRPEDFPRLFVKSPKWPGTLVNRGACIRPLAFSHGPLTFLARLLFPCRKLKSPSLGYKNHRLETH